MIVAALTGACPQCGARSLFSGLIAFAPRCRSCGLDLAQFNVGDGPAAFLTLIVGAVVMIGAVTLQLIATPSVWIHVFVWPVLTFILVIGGLRVGKAALLQSEYRK